MTPNQERWTIRRQVMCDLRDLGFTLQDIGDLLKITRERVRQILLDKKPRYMQKRLSPAQSKKLDKKKGRA